MIKIKTVKVRALTCDRCGNDWQIPYDKPAPKVCVACKSVKWNSGSKAKAKTAA